MSKINDLIKEMCPDGVEKISLGSLMNRIKEKNYDNSCIDTVYSVTKENGIVKSDDLHDFNVYSDDLSNYSILRKNQSAYNPARLNIGSIARLKNDEVGLVSPMYVIFELDQDKIDFEYFEHLLFSKKVFNDMCSFVEQGARFRFDYKNWNKIFIELPPLKIQKEIVKILNKFIDMQNILEAELESRKSQYIFWRGKLLNNDKYNAVKIDDISYSVSSGKCSSRNNEGLYPVYGSTGIISKTDEYLFDTDKLLIARVGANAGYVHIANGKYNVTDNTLIVDLKEDVDLRFMYYYLQNYNLNKLAKGGGQPLITGGQIKELEINLPPLTEQKRISKILDKFEKLTNDITVGLPAEIELRRKQYEYYRNKLLSFEELSVSE